MTVAQLQPSDRSAPRVPSRDQLKQHLVAVLRKKRRRNADLYLVDIGDGPMVVKDFAAKSRWTRFLGRMQIRHECRAYRKLSGLECIPRFIGRIDRHAMAIEKVEVTQLTYADDRYSAGHRHLEGLRDILDEFQARGFVHLDLRGRRNVMQRDSGEVLVLDLAGAVWFRPGTFWHWLFRPLIVMNYCNTLSKWKVLLAPDALSDGEKVSLHRFRRLQRLWFFNRKGSNNKKWPMSFPRAVELPPSDGN